MMRRILIMIMLISHELNNSNIVNLILIYHYSPLAVKIYMSIHQLHLPISSRSNHIHMIFNKTHNLKSTQCKLNSFLLFIFYNFYFSQHILYFIQSIRCVFLNDDDDDHDDHANYHYLYFFNLFFFFH